MRQINSAVTPGSYLPTEEFPIFKWIPRRWLGSNVRAEKCFHTITSIWTEALKRVERRRDKGDRRECMVDGLLDEEIKIKYARHFDGTKLANFFGTVMEAAGETTTHAMRTNILFLAKHPWIQEKAQKEIDALCGTKRMPTFADFKKLPYINCIVKEGLRIRPM
jgi:cytochrome P450